MARFLGCAVVMTMILMTVPADQARARIDPFRNSAAQDLTEKDIEVIGAAAEPLYKAENPEVGNRPPG